MELREFIEARLAEDERIAQFATPALGEKWTPMYGEAPVQLVNVDDHAKRHSPARVLREVAAKRAILAAYVWFLDQPEVGDWGRWALRGTVATLEDTLRVLASAWADHPDYRTEWSVT